MAKGDKKPVVMTGDRAVPSGIATLDASGNVPFEQLGNVVRPNLLINPYLLNPVNQRGQTEYTVSGYTIDGWKLATWSTSNFAARYLENEGIQLYNKTSSSTTCEFKQSVWNPQRFAGKTVTFSVLYDTPDEAANVGCMVFLRADDAVVSLKSLKIGQNLITTITVTLPANISSLTASFGQNASHGGSGNMDVTVKAIKLELGSTQTLAHQDADGNWVLNEIPDYSEELRKCQWYLKPIFVKGTTNYVTTISSNKTDVNVMITGINMRSTPSLLFHNCAASDFFVHRRDAVSHVVKGQYYPTSLGIAPYGGASSKERMTLVFSFSEQAADNEIYTIDCSELPERGVVFACAEL